MTREFLSEMGIDEETATALLEVIEHEISDIKSEYIRMGLSDKYSRAVFGALASAGAKNVTAARSVLEYEWDGDDFDSEPLGLSDAVTSLKTSMPFLFKDETECGEAYSFVGISPVEESDGDVSPDELSYSEYMRLYGSRSKK